LDTDECGNEAYSLYYVLITYAVILFVDAAGSIPFIWHLNRVSFAKKHVLKFTIYLLIFLFIYFVLAIYIIATYFDDEDTCAEDNPALDTMMTVILILVFLALVVALCVGFIIAVTYYKKQDFKRKESEPEPDEAQELAQAQGVDS
jgi:predicted permease